MSIKSINWILLRAIKKLSRLQLDRYRRLAEPAILERFRGVFFALPGRAVSCEAYQQYADELAGNCKRSVRGSIPTHSPNAKKPLAREQEIARAYRASEDCCARKKCSSFGTLITGAVAVSSATPICAPRCKTAIATSSLTNFRIPTSRNLRLLSCWSTNRKIFCRGRQRPGHPTAFAALLRQLQALSRALCQLARRTGLHEIPREPDGKLPLYP